MAKKKSTGMSKRVSFLDRDVVAENREILRYNQRLEREERERARLEREKERELRRAENARNARVRLLEGVTLTSEAIRDAADVLLETLGARGRFGDAAKAGWEHLKGATDPSLLPVRRLEWNHVVHLIGVNAEKQRPGSVPKGILATTQMPSGEYMSLVEAGLLAPGGAEVSRMVEKLARLLLEGTPITAAVKQVWRSSAGRLDEEKRRETARTWGIVSRAVGEEWKKTHPDDTLPSLEEEQAERKAAQAAKRREALSEAGKSVESWPIFAYEGEILVNLLADGVPVKEALKSATEVLNERGSSCSPAEWIVVKNEWAKITDSLVKRQMELVRR